MYRNIVIFLSPRFFMLFHFQAGEGGVGLLFRVWESDKKNKRSSVRSLFMNVLLQLHS